MKTKGKSGRRLTGKGQQKRSPGLNEDVRPGLDETIATAIADLHQINAVLRSGYVAALYSDWHEVSPLMLADIFRAASHLAYISIDQLERAALEDARLAREKSGRQQKRPMRYRMYLTASSDNCRS